jgi:hypothetical protein
MQSPVSKGGRIGDMVCFYTSDLPERALMFAADP